MFSVPLDLLAVGSVWRPRLSQTPRRSQRQRAVRPGGKDEVSRAPPSLSGGAALGPTKGKRGPWPPGLAAGPAAAVVGVCCAAALLERLRRDPNASRIPSTTRLGDPHARARLVLIGSFPRGPDCPGYRVPVASP